MMIRGRKEVKLTENRFTKNKKAEVAASAFTYDLLMTNG